MIVTIKGLQKDGSDDLTDINVNQKLQKIQQTIQSYDTATAVNVFNNDKGPNNATNMIWPAFKGFPFEMFFFDLLTIDYCEQASTDGLPASVQLRLSVRPMPPSAVPIHQ